MATVSAVTGQTRSVAGAGDVHVQSRDRPDTFRFALWAMLCGSILLQRFALPVPGIEVSLCIAVNYAALLALGLSNRLLVEPLRFALLSASFIFVALSTVLNPGSSLPSAVLLVFTYLPFVFVMPTSREVFEDALRFLSDLILICALLGIVQFLVQYILSPPWLFTFVGTMPDIFLLDGYNTKIPISYGSPIYKSNGFLMLEPSHFSQLLSLGMVLEVAFFRRWRRFTVLLLALPMTFSGTGILLLLAFMPYLIVLRRAVGLMVLVFSFACVAIAFGDLWHIDAILARMTEFNSEGSSGFARFVAPMDLLAEQAVADPIAFLFGSGPGSISALIRSSSHEVHDPTWAKLVIEYGVFGSCIFLTFVFVSVFGRCHSRLMSAMLMFGYFLFGGMLLSLPWSTMFLVFSTLLTRRDEVVSDN